MKMKAAIAASLMILLLIGCTNPTGRTADTEMQPEEPVVLEEGSTDDGPGYFVTDDGTVIYEDSRTRLPGQETDSESTNEADENAMPVFPGAQRIYPAGEDPEARQSYMTRAPIDAVAQFYNNYLAYGKTEFDDESSEEGINVNVVTSEEDGRRQATLFVNESDGPRGGMKVILKEYPAQHAVQIVHTTLDATPVGLNPIGTFVTPEEVAQWAEEYERQQEEIERRRQEAEGEAIDPHEEDGGNSEESEEE